jgi:hypothetical protein
LEHVDRAPIGDSRDGRRREILQRRLVVERRRKDAARLDEEFGRIARASPARDVLQKDDETAILGWKRAHGQPALDLRDVGFVFGRAPRRHCVAEEASEFRVVDARERRPHTSADHRADRLSQQLGRALVQVRESEFRIDRDTCVSDRSEHDLCSLAFSPLRVERSGAIERLRTELPDCLEVRARVVVEDSWTAKREDNSSERAMADDNWKRRERFVASGFDDRGELSRISRVPVSA